MQHYHVIGDMKMDENKLTENKLALTVMITSSLHWNKIEKIMIKTTHGKNCCIYNHTDIVSTKEVPQIVMIFNNKSRRVHMCIS